MNIKTDSTNVVLVESVAELTKYFESADNNDILFWDWETTGLEYNAIPVVLSLYIKGEDPRVVPFDFLLSKGLPSYEVIDTLNKYFPKFRMAAHNAKYDSMINKMNGILDENCRITYDTLVMIHLYDPSIPKNLEKRVELDFGYSKKTFEQLSGKKWSKINWLEEGEELLPILAGYTGEDAYWTGRIFDKYSKLLDEKDWQVHDKIEIPLIPIIRDAKIRGVKIDKELLLEFDDKITTKLDTLQNEIFDECGCVFNLNSPKQKAEVFFDKMKLPVISYTKTGAPSTDSDTYEAWDDMGISIGSKLNLYSVLNKLRSGYTTAIPAWLDENNVLRGDLNSTGTETGRFASSNPNLQNIPNNHDFPIRDAFIPRDGYVFVNYDYSQLELRVMAHLSGDKHFTEAFNNGEDIHGMVAKKLDIPRKGAKVVNFGVLYGMGPDKLAHTINVPVKDAKRIIQVDYEGNFTGFRKWKQETQQFAERNGYVRNIFGRRRRLPDAAKSPFERNKYAYFKALRQSVNTLVQGTGADVVKLATIKMVNEFKSRGLDAHFLLQVHDEVLIEVRKDQMFEVERIVIDSMQEVIKFNVPLEVDGKILANWGEMKNDDVVSLPFRFDYSLIMGLN